MNITPAMICIGSSTSGLKLTDCTNVVSSKYFRWQDLGQAVGGGCWHFLFVWLIASQYTDIVHRRAQTGLEMAFCTFLFLEATNQPRTKVVKRYTFKNGWIHCR